VHWISEPFCEQANAASGIRVNADVSGFILANLVILKFQKWLINV